MSTALEGGKCKACGGTEFWNQLVSGKYKRALCKKCHTEKVSLARRRGTLLRRAFKNSVVAVPDIHYPFHHEGAYAWMLEVVEKLQPALVIQLGDLMDLLSFTRYPRSANIMTPREEIAEARELAVEMWASIKKASPKSRCVQLRGNHDDRASKRVIEYLPAIESLVMPAINALFQFEGVETISDSAEEFEFDGVLYHHGDRTFGQHMAYNNMSTVNGHLHRGGVIFKQTQDGVIWELNAGFLGDVRAPGFSYHARKRLHGCTLGLGIVDQFGPRFVPYQERR